MLVVPELIGVADLRVRQSEVFERLRERPIVLTQRGKAVAVLASPEQWNAMVEEIEDLQDALAAMEARHDTGPLTDFDEYVAKRNARVSPDAQQPGS